MCLPIVGDDDYHDYDDDVGEGRRLDGGSRVYSMEETFMWQAGSHRHRGRVS